MQLRSGLVVANPSQHPPAPSSAPTGAAAPPQPSSTPASNEREAAFREGVRLCLLQWTALQLAVENQWGGRNSALRARELGEDIVAWFAARAHKRGEDGSPRFYADELEDVLDEAVLQGFNTELDDGSLEEVSKRLVLIHEQCWVGDFSTVLQLQQEERQKQEKGGRSAAATSRRQATQGDEDSEDEEMGEGTEDGRLGGGQFMTVDGKHLGAQSTAEMQSGLQGQQGVTANSSAIMSNLSQQEVDDGWQQVPSTRSRKR